MQEVRFLLADSVLCGNTAANLAAVVHDEGLDHAFGPLLQASVFVAWQHNVQVQVAIADVTVSIWKDKLFFFRGKLGRILD